MVPMDISIPSSSITHLRYKGGNVKERGRDSRRNPNYIFLENGGLYHFNHKIAALVEERLVASPHISHILMSSLGVYGGGS